MTKLDSLVELSSNLYEKIWPTLQWLESFHGTIKDPINLERMIDFLEFAVWPSIAKLTKHELWEVILNTGGVFEGECMKQLMFAEFNPNSFVKHLSTNPKLRYLQGAATVNMAAELLGMYPLE